MIRMVRYVGVILVIALFPPAIAAQTIAKATYQKNLHADIKPLTIGSKVPDIFFGNVLNYKTKTARLSDFKGKLVILDMWSTWCTSCIAGFPKMESFQKEFGNKVQILLVNPHPGKYDSEEKIKETLAKNKERTGYYPGLPIPMHDSVLNKYFPHDSVPHTIWINGEGVVVGITGSLEVTRENISAMLEGRSVGLPVKDDWAFDSEKPLLVDDNGGKSGDFVYRSMFTGYKGNIGFESGLRTNANKEVIGYYELNKSLRTMISSAYAEILNNTSASKTILEVKNPAAFSWDFREENAFCYDLTIPPTPSELFKPVSFLKIDLKRFFNISVRIEKRQMKCYVFKASPELSKAFTRNSTADYDLEAKSIKKYIHNYSVKELLKILDYYLNKPSFDETGIDVHIDINFPDHFDFSDADKLLHFLKKIGFKVYEEDRELDVVIISDKYSN